MTSMEPIFVIILILAIGYLISKSAGTFRFPGTIAFLFFGILYVWNKFGALTYSYNFELRHAFYLVACLLIFSVAALAGMTHVRHTYVITDDTRTTSNVLEKSAPFLILVGIVGGLMMVFDIRSNYVASSFIPSNLSDVREAFAEKNTGPLGQIGSVLFGTSLPGLILGMRQWLRKNEFANRHIGFLLLLLIGAMFAVSIFSGGRQAIIEVMASFIAVLLYGGAASFNNKRMKVFLLTVLSVTVIGSTYMIAVASQRAEFGMAGEKFLLRYWDMDYAEWFIPVSEKLSAESVLPIIAVHGYFPHNLKGLAVFIDAVNEHSWGGFQGEHILRQFRKLGMEWPFEFTIKSDSDISGINWPTIFGAMIVDFGLTGCLAVMSVIGWLAGVQFGKYIYFNISSAYVVTAIIFVCVFHSTMYSPFQETTLLYGLIWTILISLVINYNSHRQCTLQTP
jgi:hypothetical protein